MRMYRPKNYQPLAIVGEYPKPEKMERITNTGDTVFYWTGKDVLYGTPGDIRGGYFGEALYNALRHRSYDLLAEHNKRLLDFLQSKLRKVN